MRKTSHRHIFTFSDTSEFFRATRRCAKKSFRVQPPIHRLRVHRQRPAISSARRQGRSERRSKTTTKTLGMAFGARFPSRPGHLPAMRRTDAVGRSGDDSEICRKVTRKARARTAAPAAAVPDCARSAHLAVRQVMEDHGSRTPPLQREPCAPADVRRHRQRTFPKRRLPWARAFADAPRALAPPLADSSSPRAGFGTCRFSGSNVLCAGRPWTSNGRSLTFTAPCTCAHTSATCSKEPSPR